MKPSCWLPTVRFTQRDMARPAVSGPVLLLEQRPLDALEQDAEGGKVEVDPLEPIDHGRRLERGGQLGADLLGHDRLDPQQRGPIERLGRGALARGDRGRRVAEPPMRDVAHRLPVDEPRAGAAHDLARGDAGAEGEQAADEDARAEAGGVACHAPQSRRMDADRLDPRPIRPTGAASPKSRVRDSHEGVHLAGGRDAVLEPACRAAPVRRARRAGPRRPARW